MSRTSHVRTGLANAVFILTATQAVPQDRPFPVTDPMFWPVAAMLFSVMALVAVGAWLARPPVNARHCSSHHIEAVIGLVSSGVVGIDAQQNIVMINAAGRRMLGGISKATPFAWPSNIQLNLEGQHVKPIAESFRTPCLLYTSPSPRDS